MLDFTFAILTVLSFRPERAGTLVYVSIFLPPPPPHFSFLSYPLFMLIGENGWGLTTNHYVYRDGKVQDFLIEHILAYNVYDK